MASTLTLGEAVSVPAVFISAAAAASCLFSESFCLFGFNVRVRLRQLAFHGIRPSSLVPASGNQLRAETTIAVEDAAGLRGPEGHGFGYAQSMQQTKGIFKTLDQVT